MSGSNEVIYIRAQSKTNSLTTLLVAIVALLVAILIFQWLPKTFFLIGILVLSASLVALLLAWFKYREPSYSMLLDKRGIIYQHRLGQWRLEWQNIQRVDIPKLGGRELSMVGIRLKEYPTLVDAISARLATHLLLEQRPLLLQSQEGCTSGQCYSEDMLEDDKHKLPNGQQIKGVKAMYANRLQKLRSRLGYDIFINGTELDRSELDFIALLKQCQESVLGPGSTSS